MGRGIEHMQYAWFKAKVKVVVDDAVHTCNAASINRTNRSPRQYIWVSRFNTYLSGVSIAIRPTAGQEDSDLLSLHLQCGHGWGKMDALLFLSVSVLQNDFFRNSKLHIEVLGATLSSRHGMRRLVSLNIAISPEQFLRFSFWCWLHTYKKKKRS